jgi:hypothetical protein
MVRGEELSGKSNAVKKQKKPLEQGLFRSRTFLP